ncbi:hypothetical protein N7486_008645 [Penicillium sp. IBT 16267x]|nr:hypothetical protein N7486_008645 [Penicillium sp. IBT 16267x]
MVQRGKVLDIEGPTPKFLYSMLKQLDLKIVDWNRVAAELGISNGHAARMRFSRFRNQMEGTTGAQRPGRKRSSKKAENGDKGEKGDPKALIFGMQEPPHPVPGPIMETGDAFQYINSVKCEEGEHRVSFPDMGELYPWSQGIPTSDTNYTPQMNPFMSHEMQHGMAYPGMPSGFPMMSSNPPWFYPPFGMPHDSIMQELPASLPNFNYNIVASLDSTPMSQPEVAPIKAEDDVQLVKVKNEPDIPIKFGMPHDLTMKELTTSLPNFNFNTVASWESTAVNESDNAPVRIEDDVQVAQVKPEPDVSIKVETFQLE